MQVARQALAFVFAGGLQVLRQLNQLGGAVGHLHLQPVTLQLHHALQLHLLQLQGLRLAQVEKQRQQADGTQQRHPKTPQRQRDVQLGTARTHGAGLVLQQLGAGGADGVHLLAPDVGHQNFLARLAAAFFIEPQGQGQLGELGLGQAMQALQQRLGFGVVAVVGVQHPVGLFNAQQRLGIRLQVLLAVGQQVAALAGFGVQHAALQHLDLGAGRAHGAEFLQGAGRAPVRGFTDKHRRRRGGEGQSHDPRVALKDGECFHGPGAGRIVGSCRMTNFPRP